jgi:hypothetical protein
MDQIGRLIVEPDNVFTDIMKFNKQESILPENEIIAKLKLNDTIIERIYKDFILKNITAKVRHTILIKDIYNIYFNKQIIKTKYENKTHCIYSISDIDREILKIGFKYVCQNNIKLNKEEFNDPFLLDKGSEDD